MGRSGRMPRNRVDKLLQEVKKIQKRCGHSHYVVSKKPRLKESLVKGVFIAYDAEARVNLYDGYSGFEMEIRCADCSATKTKRIAETCPKCLGKMQSDPGLERREMYFGRDYLYYAAKTKRCRNCDFSVVLDEWNQ